LKGDIDKAIADLDEAIRLDPDDANTYQYRGLAYEKKGEKAKAEADFAQAKKLGYKSK
jgi:Flp pilus assembly protein TadD